MYDNDSYCDWHHSMQKLVSGAAVTQFAVGPAQGEIWRVICANAYHSDPAAHNMSWYYRQGASTEQLENNVSRAQWVKHQLYDGVKVAAPIQLRFGEYLVIDSNTVLAAGCSFGLHIVVDVLVGVTS